MLFDKKVSLESSSYRRRYLARMYDRLNTVKTAFNDYTVASSSYDPYQFKQYAEEVEYDPYQRRVKYGQKVPAEKDQYPPTKRIRSMAAATVESIAHALVYSAFAAYNYVCSDKKNTYICSDSKPINENPIEENPLDENNHDIMSQDEDYIMEFTPIKTKSANAPKKRFNDFCKCPFKHQIFIDEKAQGPVPAQQTMDSSLCQSESQLNESVCLDDSVYQPNTLQSVYQPWAQPYQPEYQPGYQYSIRRNLTPIVRESNVLHNIQTLLEDKPSKRCFDDIDALDDAWEVVDKVK